MSVATAAERRRGLPRHRRGLGAAPLTRTYAAAFAAPPSRMADRDSRYVRLAGNVRFDLAGLCYVHERVGAKAKWSYGQRRAQQLTRYRDNQPRRPFADLLNAARTVTAAAPAVTRAAALLEAVGVLAGPDRALAAELRRLEDDVRWQAAAVLAAVQAPNLTDAERRAVRQAAAALDRALRARLTRPGSADAKLSRMYHPVRWLCDSGWAPVSAHLWVREPTTAAERKRLDAFHRRLADTSF